MAKEKKVQDTGELQKDSGLETSTNHLDKM
jgi:hypothetical protein